MRISRCRRLGRRLVVASTLVLVGLGCFSTNFAMAADEANSEESAAVVSEPATSWKPEFSFSGFVRSETAFKVSDQEDPFNQRGNLFNGVPVTRVSAFGTDTAVRNGIPADNTINMQLFRGELRGEVKFSESLKLQTHLLAVVDPGAYSAFDGGAVDSQAVGRLYGSPNYFKYDAQGTTYPQPLEWAGGNYQVYFPALFLDYNQGPVDVRLGMQQIAWGQAIFFRVLDVVDGLDLRRHSALDFASEEFSDKRVPAPALRITYQMTQDILLDAYAQKFQPTVYSNPNTPYNAISSQFTIHDLYRNYDDRGDFGLRMKGNFGDFGFQAIAARRYNPDGVYRWTASGVNRDFAAFPGSGPLAAQTPFEADPTGVWSAKEWFTYAGLSRLDGVEGLNAAVRDFQPVTGMLGAAEVPGNHNDPATFAGASQELDTFFRASGSGLRGHLAREYRAETDLGGGASYVISAAPGSILDQLIINVEALYVPDRTFTSPDLGKDFLRKHEWTTALVMEKYQRFFTSVPATYVVFQWLHKTESDLFGRALAGYDGSADHAASGVAGGYNAVALALQQPFPNLIWRADFAALYDPRGGLLLQPGVRWKPNGRFTVEAFYNFIDGHLNGNPNNNALSTFDYADEISLRLGYQF